MSFDWPVALLGLLVVPLLVLAYVLRERRRARFASRFTNPALLPNLVGSSPGRRRHLPLAIMLAALTVMVVGVARPHANVNVKREEATVVLAVDVSTSMTSKDVEPTRLVAARIAARAFVRKVPAKYRVGLVSFARRAVPLVPPTHDRAAFEAGLMALRPGDGTALGDAVRMSAELARGRVPRGQPAPPAAVLLISDGTRTAGRISPSAAARRARALRTPVYTIVLGTPDGVIERTLTGGFRELTRVPPDPRALQAIADTTGGELFEAPDDERLKQVYEELGSRLGTRKQRRELTDFFSAGAGVLLLVGGTLSTLWFRRII